MSCLVYVTQADLSRDLCEDITLFFTLWKRIILLLYFVVSCEILTYKERFFDFCELQCMVTKYFGVDVFSTFQIRLKPIFFF